MGVFRRPGHLGDQIFHAPGAKLWHYAVELLTLSVTFHLYGSAFSNTTANQSEMCPPKLSLFLYHQSFTVLQGPHITPLGFTSCHDCKEES